MPAVLSFLGRVGLSLLKRTGSFFSKKASSYLSSGTRFLSDNLQRRGREEREKNSQSQVLQALGLIKKPSFLDKLLSDQPLLITLVCLGGIIFILMLQLFSSLISASGLVTLWP